jgi:enterobactin synthetase component D / holo-[acyl-carrier protein] synthase
VIAAILPPTVVAVETIDDGAEATLLPEEEAVVAGALPKRRNEFAAVRQCARTALHRLGHPACPILPGERGGPRWPPRIVGSMTHCSGYRAAALAHACDVITIGIDAEPHAAAPDGVVRTIALPSERTMLARLSAAEPRVHWDRVLFCAKESVYKAWYPLTRRWLDYLEAEIVLDAGGRFLARLLVPGPRVEGRCHQEFDGRYLVRDGLIVTAIAVVTHG